MKRANIRATNLDQKLYYQQIESLINIITKDAKLDQQIKNEIHINRLMD